MITLLLEGRYIVGVEENGRKWDIDVCDMAMYELPRATGLFDVIDIAHNFKCQCGKWYPIRKAQFANEIAYCLDCLPPAVEKGEAE